MAKSTRAEIPYGSGGTKAAPKPARKPAGGPEIRQAVTEAAERLFRERSPADVTLREIAAEAGVNHSLLYRYFRTKEAILASVFYDVVNNIRTNFIEAPEGRAALREVQYLHDAPGYARALAWAILEGTNLDLLFTNPEPDGESNDPPARGLPLKTPRSAADIDSRVVVASFLVLAMGWDLYEPYLLRITGMEGVDKAVLNDHLTRISDVLLSLGGPASG
jgi:TetR/AcrR family transcriptional regulator, repressor for neighboring sulfatase